MRAGERAKRLIAGSLLLALAGCGFGRKEAPAAGTAPPPAEIAASQGKGDTAVSVDLGFGRLDTLKVMSAEASELYLLTLDNFLTVAPGDPKAPEVLLWKGNHLYNQGEYRKSLDAYRLLLERKPSQEIRGEALQMTAQAHAQLGQYEAAEKVYRDMLGADDAEARTEARDRLAQAIYLQAERSEREGRLQTASELYSRVAREFPTVEIAPVALFNAGVMQEKQKKWKEAIALYGGFFEAFFRSDLLPKVLFREAKCRELDGQWESAGVKYLNLARTYPRSPEAEPALYNAGFAFANGKMPDSAARAFEAYAKRHADNAEAPNLLFRAAELYGELKDWDKVAELQSLFTRRYASDRNRLIQAMCLGGSAEYQRGRYGEAARLMSRVVAEFASLNTRDAGARFYAAQAQHTLGEIAARRMRSSSLRPGSHDADVRAKSALLRAAVGEYLKVFDYRIVDWAMRAAYSMGEAFEDFGTQIHEGPRNPGRGADPLAGEEEALATLTSAYAKAQQQYLQVLSVGRSQEVNNKWVEESGRRLMAMARRLASIQARVKDLVPRLIRVDASTPEKAIAGKLRQIERIAPIHEEGQKYFNSFLAIAHEYELDPRIADSLGGLMLGGIHSLGAHYLDAAGLARAAPLPRGFQPMERFFYKSKLVQEGIPKLEARAMEYFESGLDFAGRYGLAAHPLADSLKRSLGRALYIQAKCLDLLATEALVSPPIPPEAGPEQRKTYQERLENEGYRLQDLAVEKYRALVAKAVEGKVPVEWAEPAFARLYQVEPDKWSRAGDVDTVMEVASSKDWKALETLPEGAWPDAGNPGWKRVRKGVPGNLDYPAHVKTPFRFLWCGDKGIGPKVDTVSANYIPWKEIWAQAPFEWPGNVQSMELEVVGPQEWAVMLDGDTLLTHRSGKGPWHLGRRKEVWQGLAPRLSKVPRGEVRHLRLWARNQKPSEGFGVWIMLRIRHRLQGSGPVYPWNQASPSAEELRKLLELPIEIPNFTRTPGG